MQTSVRAMAAATLFAIAATTGVAAAIGSDSADATVGVPISTSQSVAEDTSPPALPAVVTSNVDRDVLDAMRPAPASENRWAEQVIKVAVIGGDLELVTDHAMVALERVSGSSRDWVGTLPPVRVIDARGNGEGWTVRWTVEDVSAESARRRVRVVPDSPVVVAGLAEGLVTGASGPSTGQQGRMLFGAEPGFGGGTYEAGGTVTLRLPQNVDAHGIVVDLAFSVS